MLSYIAHIKFLYNEVTFLMNDKNITLTLTNCITLQDPNQLTLHNAQRKTETGWKLLYVKKGQSILRHKNKEYELGQGQCLLFHSTNYSLLAQQPTEEFSFIILCLATSNHALLERLFHTFSLNWHHRSLMDNILKEYEQDNYLCDQLISSYLQAFFIHLMRLQGAPQIEQLTDTKTNIQLNNERRIVEQAMSYIQHHLFDKLTVSQVATSIPVSNSYLSKLFKRHAKQSVMDYIIHTKLEHGKELIHETNHNFTEISNILGYKSIFYFSKQFKQKYGITPTEYAKSLPNLTPTQDKSEISQ